MKSTKLPKLTDKERERIAHLCRTRGVKFVADALGISRTAVGSICAGRASKGTELIASMLAHKLDGDG